MGTYDSGRIKIITNVILFRRLRSFEKLEKIMAGFINYIQESYNELKNHVTWTPLSEAQRLTVVVAVFTIVFSLAIWGVDTVFSRAIKAYFNLVGA